MLARCLIAGLGLALLCSSGCGGGKPFGKVTGKVTHHQNPVSPGAIVFENRGAGVSAKINLNPDGTYVAKLADLAGLPPGDYQVAITPNVVFSGEAPLVTAPQGTGGSAKTSIPKKYHSVATSGLTAKVAAGENPAFDFALTD